MSTWTVGDLISGGLGWTRPVRLGGVQWRRNFGVRPDLITLPMPHFSADAVVPSTVELFVNNVRQFGGTVQDGPFVLDTLPRISGAGQASLVVTDALGRVTQTTVPLYVDYQRLAKGLTSFSVEAGLPRRHFAGPGDGYGRDPAVSASGRRGVFESLTVEGHGEATSGLGSAGVGMVWSPANRWGLATASYARAWGDTTGGQYALGYQFNNSRVGVDVQTLRRHDGYRDLGDASADDIAPIASTRAQDRGTLWVPLGRGSLALSVVRWRDGVGGAHRTRSLSWTQNVGSHLYVSASAFDDRDGGRGGGLVLSIPLGTEAQASATVRRDDNGTSASAALWRRAPYAGGWGWRVQGGGGADSYGQAVLELRGRAGETTFGVERRSGSTGAFFQGGGSVALMDGRFFLSRPIHDAFAVVSTDGVADVPVLSENRPYGRTNGAGYLLIPELRGWQRNRVAIDPDALGAAYRVGRVEQDATPADGSGVLVAFDVTAVNPAVVVLLGPDGTPAAAGSRGRIVGTGAPVLVGFDGEAYIENVKDDTVIEMEFGEVTCRYPVPASADGGHGRPAPLPCVRRAP
jgi:outer membrane usher protein